MTERQSTQAQNSPLIQQVNRLRAQQAAREGAELERLVRTYQQIDQMARREAEALALALMQKYEGTNGPTENELRKLARYREMMETIDRELAEYQSWLGRELRAQGGLSVTEGERDARILATAAARGMGITAQFRALNPAVIEQLVGFLAPDGPLYKRLGMLGGWTSEQVSSKIIEGVSKGLNPRTTARMLTKTLQDGVTERLGMGLTSAMTTMRTVQLYGYREANRASYVANSDVVKGWIWHANLVTACVACLSMHATVHPLDEPLNDHHCGKCSALPLVIGSNLDKEITSGKQYFDGLDAERQKEIMGKGMLEAYKAGKFDFADIPGSYPDEVYGQMRKAKTLKELIGGE